MRLRPLAATFCCLAAVSGCGVTEPLPREGPPRLLSFASYGFGVPTVEVRLVDDTTVVATTTHPWDAAVPARVTRRVPAAEEWEAFWRAVRAAGVRAWPAACRDRNVQDGGGFVFELAWAGERHVGGSYSNAYPTRRGGCNRDPGYTAEASAFVDAVLALGFTAADVGR